MCITFQWLAVLAPRRLRYSCLTISFLCHHIDTYIQLSRVTTSYVKPSMQHHAPLCTLVYAYRKNVYRPCDAHRQVSWSVDDDMSDSVCSAGIYNPDNGLSGSCIRQTELLAYVCHIHRTLDTLGNAELMLKSEGLRV